MAEVHENTSSGIGVVPMPAITEDPCQGNTLLPHPIASVISFAARSSSLSLRVGTFFGNAAVSGARATTLTGLECGRGILEGIISRAGRDVVDNSTGDQAKEAMESYIEWTLASLHSAITQTSFWVSSGFQVTSSTLSYATAFSQHFLASLDQILGDTESSRAIAAIVTLTRQEFGTPSAGLPGENLRFLDLLIGTTAFALLQKWCYVRTEQELEDQGTADIVWDVVALDNGKRADVITARPSTAVSARYNRRRVSLPSRSMKSRPTSFISASNGQEVLEALPREDQALNDILAFSQAGLAQRDDPTSDFDRLLTAQLPRAARISVRSVVTKLVLVEINGQLPPKFQPPPGYSIVKQESQGTSELPFHRILFEANKQATGATCFERAPGKNLLAGTAPSPDPPISIGAGDFHEIVEMPPRREKHFETAGIRPSEAERSDEIASTPGEGGLTFETEMGKPPVQNSTIQVISPNRGNDCQANQKRRRISPNSRLSVSTRPQCFPSVDHWYALKENSTGDLRQKIADSSGKKKSLRQALKQRASNSNFANLWNKELLSKSKTKKGTTKAPSKENTQASSPNRNPQSPSSLFQDVLSNNASHSFELKRSPSRMSFYSIHRREGAFTSETYSTEYIESPRQETSRTPSIEAEPYISSEIESPRSPEMHTESMSCQAHSRSNSIISDISTITNGVPVTDLCLGNLSRASDNNGVSLSLYRSGYLPGQFPRDKFVHNVSRYSKYAIASYGSTFLRVMGAVARKPSARPKEEDGNHQEHYSFSNYTNLTPSSIILSSFVDPQGGTNAWGQTVPLVHYVSLDHVSKAVVLTCRGTLEFNDVLTDMACDYDHIIWRGSTYTIHKGILASARRLIEGRGGRVLAVIKTALEEFEEYGLVLCGHSLGGSVTAVLAILLSEPNTSDIFNLNPPAFVTSKQLPKTQPLPLPSTEPAPTTNEFSLASSFPVLPPGRPIHVYAYGPPAAVSPALGRACRGLITTICLDADLVPYLSLGLLRDIQAVSLAFKVDNGGAKAEIKRRIWDGLTATLHGHFGGENFWDNNNSWQANLDGEDTWPWAALKSLRANMIHEKLVPPGEVFVVETSRVRQRDAFASGTPETSETGVEEGTKVTPPMLGRPATRVQMKRVGKPEKWFSELRLRGSMFVDHSPIRYENALAVLKKSVSA